MNTHLLAEQRWLEMRTYASALLRRSGRHPSLADGDAAAEKMLGSLAVGLAESAALPAIRIRLRKASKTDTFCA